ncbi:MAG: PTS sugar transporter subunit IIC [Armatimonadota bacterium]
MSTFLSRLEKPLMSAAGKLGQQPHLNAIRDGVVGALPLILIGSLFLLAAQPPLTPALMDKYYAVMVNGKPLFLQLLVAFQVLVGLIALYVAFGVASSLARRKNLDVLSAGLLAVAALLLINGIPAATALTPDGVKELVATGTVSADHVITVGKVLTPDGIRELAAQGAANKVNVVNGKYLPFFNLGSGGLFMAIILGLLVPGVMGLAKRLRWEIRMPDGVPPAVGRSFSALIPGLLVLVPLWAVVHLLGIDLFDVINTVLTKPVLALSADGTSVFIIMLVIILIDSILWLLGVHAVAILAPMAAIWLLNMTSNGEAVTAGHMATQLNTREALQFFIWTGGSGATIALPFLLLRARAASLRAIAKVGAVPALFNINEPLIFGVPVMMNVTLFIPFIVAPIVTLTTTVLATSLGLVPIPHLVVPWTLPGPIGGFLATGGAWTAAVLSVVNIALAALIYWPFVRALDRRMALAEAEAQAALPGIAFVERSL